MFVLLVGKDAHDISSHMLKSPTAPAKFLLKSHCSLTEILSIEGRRRKTKLKISYMLGVCLEIIGASHIIPNGGYSI